MLYPITKFDKVFSIVLGPLKIGALFRNNNNFFYVLLFFVFLLQKNFMAFTRILKPFFRLQINSDIFHEPFLAFCLFLLWEDFNTFHQRHFYICEKNIWFVLYINILPNLPLFVRNFFISIFFIRNSFIRVVSIRFIWRNFKVFFFI